jgi:hypothetical protein
MKMQPAQPGEAIAFRADGARLIYDYNEDDLDWGHILMPDGTEIARKPLVSILARGYWSAEPPND